MYLPPSIRPDHRRLRLPVPRRHAQRGATLLFALITLVALLLATLALVRSVDTSTALMGNIGFKQGATVSGDQATRLAVKWLNDNLAGLNTDLAANGYSASTQEDGTAAKPPVDVSGQQLAGTASRQLIDWDGNKCAAFTGLFKTCLNDVITPVKATITGSNTAQYVVFRLCSLPGDYTISSYAGTCAVPMTNSLDGVTNKGEEHYGHTPFAPGSSGPYYRIVVRVQGARNTTSFTETIVHF
jgi:type IV pilus assembly protein PilX